MWVKRGCLRARRYTCNMCGLCERIALINRLTLTDVSLSNNGTRSWAESILSMPLICRSFSPGLQLFKSAACYE